MEKVDEVENLPKKKVESFSKYFIHLICLAVGDNFVEADNLAVEDGDAVEGLGHHGGGVLSLLHLRRDTRLGRVGIGERES